METIKFSYFSHCFGTGLIIGDIRINSDDQNLPNLNYIKDKISILIDKTNFEEKEKLFTAYVDYNYKKNNLSKEDLSKSIKQALMKLTSPCDIIELSGFIIELIGVEEYNNDCETCGDYNYSYIYELKN